jgi:broad specificity phosphatase PhoE
VARRSSRAGSWAGEPRLAPQSADHRSGLPPDPEGEAFFDWPAEHTPRYASAVLTLLLTRHGSTPRSDPEQHLGQRIDLELSAAGRAAAEALGRRLDGVELARVISSPLRRARETAQLVVPGAALELDDRLKEMDYGRWEGLTYEEILVRDGDARRIWEADPASLACPDGESGSDVARRVRSWLEELIEWASADGDGAVDRRVLAVGHSTTNRVLLCVSLGVALRDYRRRFVQHPANLTVLRFEGAPGSGGKLLVGNDVSHLRGVRGVTWEGG